MASFITRELPETFTNVTKKEDLGDGRWLVTTASTSVEEAQRWASQLWSEMCSYGEFSIEDFIGQLEGHFTEEVLDEIRKLYTTYP